MTSDLEAPHVFFRHLLEHDERASHFRLKLEGPEVADGAGLGARPILVMRPGRVDEMRAQDKFVASSRGPLEHHRPAETEDVVEKLLPTHSVEKLGCRGGSFGVIHSR